MANTPSTAGKRKGGSGSGNSSPANLASLLECPVCFDYVIPPVFQCVAGHLVCSACRPKLSCCPTCRGPFQEIKDESFDDQPVDMTVKRFKRSKPTEVNRRRPSVIAFASNGLPRGTNASAKRRRTDNAIRSPAAITIVDITPSRKWYGDGSTSRKVSMSTTVDVSEHFLPGAKNGKEPKDSKDKEPPMSLQVIAPRKCSRTRVIIEEAKTAGEMQSFIDEHFRRSLGSEKFTDLFKIKPKSENNDPSTDADDEKEEEEENKYNEKEKESPEDKKPEVEQASVDDHFAKALGSDYWLKLNKSIPKNSK